MGDKLIIFDINGVLGKKTLNNWVIFPNIELLFNIPKNIKVVIWSSCMMKNIKKFMIESKLKNIDTYCRKLCTSDPDGRSFDTLKPLERIWNIYPKYNKTNTVIFDDSVSKIRFNIENAILIKDIDEKDIIKNILFDIEQLESYDDVREYVKNKNMIDIE